MEMEVHVANPKAFGGASLVREPTSDGDRHACGAEAFHTRALLLNRLDAGRRSDVPSSDRETAAGLFVSAQASAAESRRETRVTS
jgi:hypothetical protein